MATPHVSGVASLIAAREPSLGYKAIKARLLDQAVLAGVGNVWKSEILFDCQLDPRTPAAALDDAELSALLQRASELMQAHVASGATQRPVRIYGRGGRDCPVCGTDIRARAQGDEGRRTFWCPTCQPSRAAASPKNA